MHQAVHGLGEVLLIAEEPKLYVSLQILKNFLQENLKIEIKLKFQWTFSAEHYVQIGWSLDQTGSTGLGKSTFISKSTE